MKIATGYWPLATGHCVPGDIPFFHCWRGDRFRSTVLTSTSTLSHRWRGDMAGVRGQIQDSNLVVYR